MSTAEAILSPIALAKALKDVAQVDIDPSSANALQLAAPHVERLLGDAEKSAQLLERLDFHTSTLEPRSGSANSLQDNSSFVPLPATGVRVATEDDLFEDAPTEGRLPQIKNMLEQIMWEAVPGDTVIGASNALVWWRNYHRAQFESFRHSGLKEAFLIPQERQKEDFSFFISSALDRLPKERGSFFKRVRWLFGNEELAPLVVHTWYGSQNSGDVVLKHGDSNSRLLYVMAENTLFVTVLFNDKLTLHSRASINDPEAFSNEIVQAFDGHTEYATVALKSMRRTFDNDFMAEMFRR